VLSWRGNGAELRENARAGIPLKMINRKLKVDSVNNFREISQGFFRRGRGYVSNRPDHAVNFSMDALRGSCYV
jgi:hypothetical protein